MDQVLIDCFKCKFFVCGGTPDCLENHVFLGSKAEVPTCDMYPNSVSYHLWPLNGILIFFKVMQ